MLDAVKIAGTVLLVVPPGGEMDELMHGGSLDVRIDGPSEIIRHFCILPRLLCLRIDSSP